MTMGPPFARRFLPQVAWVLLGAIGCVQVVGTGKPFQVPSLLGLAARPPCMHDGCAPTLEQRFALECGGRDKHGKTSQLTPAQLADLVKYLESL